jgi:hypothetical protein
MNFNQQNYCLPRLEIGSIPKWLRAEESRMLDLKIMLNVLFVLGVLFLIKRIFLFVYEGIIERREEKEEAKYGDY